MSNMISFRLNEEYDSKIIDIMKQYKEKKELSKLLRQFIRDGFKNMYIVNNIEVSENVNIPPSNTTINTTTPIKWNFPK